jgi:hypothetical protein
LANSTPLRTSTTSTGKPAQATPPRSPLISPRVNGARHSASITLTTTQVKREITPKSEGKVNGKVARTRSSPQLSPETKREKFGPSAIASRLFSSRKRATGRAPVAAPPQTKDNPWEALDQLLATIEQGAKEARRSREERARSVTASPPTSPRPDDRRARTKSRDDHAREGRRVCSTSPLKFRNIEAANRLRERARIAKSPEGLRRAESLQATRDRRHATLRRQQNHQNLSGKARRSMSATRETAAPTDEKL